MNSNKKIAILIDGENAESCLIEQIIEEVEKLGTVTIKRLYGDFSNGKMNKWKEPSNKHAISTVHKFANSTGKNSTDIALVIDAMDIFYSKSVDGFCIVSSDSDYTGLALKLRTEGFFVMGIGRKTTLELFVQSCEKFIFTENLTRNGNNPNTMRSKKNKPKINPIQKLEDIENKVKIEMPHVTSNNKMTNRINMEYINKAYKIAFDKKFEGASLSKFLVALKQVEDSFDYKNYGCSKFRKFCEKLIPDYAIYALNEKNLSIRKIE